MEEKKKSIGLWKHTSKDGKSYISGKDRDTQEKFTIFQNSYKKEGTNDPDYKMYREPLIPGLNEEPKKVVHHNFYNQKTPQETTDQDVPF